MEELKNAEIKEIETEAEKVKQEEEEIGEIHEESFAMEILKELKKQNKRIMRIVYALIIAICVVTASFLIYMYEYDFSSYEITSNDGGNANYIGNDGDIYNGNDKGTPSEEEGR